MKLIIIYCKYNNINLYIYNRWENSSVPKLTIQISKERTSSSVAVGTSKMTTTSETTAEATNESDASESTLTEKPNETEKTENVFQSLESEGGLVTAQLGILKYQVLYFAL